MMLRPEILGNRAAETGSPAARVLSSSWALTCGCVCGGCSGQYVCAWLEVGQGQDLSIAICSPASPPPSPCHACCLSMASQCSQSLPLTSIHTTQAQAYEDEHAGQLFPWVL